MPSVTARTSTVAWAALVVAAALGAWAPLGCSSSDTSDSEASGGTSEPVAISIAYPTDGACIAIGTDPNAEVPITVSVTNLALRPPDACGIASPCGHLMLSVNGVVNNLGSAEVIPVLLRKLGNRYADLEVSVRIVGDDGVLVLDPSSDAGVPLEARVIFTTKASCDEGAGGSGGSGAGGAGSLGAGGG